MNRIARILFFFALVTLNSSLFTAEPKVLEMEFIKEKLPAKPLRLVMAGDSITWCGSDGGGLLDSGFTGVVDRYLREELATTIMPSAMKLEGTTKTIRNPKFYRGTATELIGEGASAEFELFGDELSLCFVRERGNQAAAEVEVFANGKPIGRFDTLNHEEFGNERKMLVGDGKSVKFDLGRCFTYGHEVRVDGKKLTGELHSKGYGGKFPTGKDYLVIRKYHYPDKNSKPEVHHVLWLRTAPGEGSKIEVYFNYGENIMYAKTTVTETGGPGSKLESVYGDGRVSFDPANPSRLSSGLDFRSSDSRSVATFKFEKPEKRKFKLIIKKNAKNGGAKPKLILNFATNRFHHIMNAGIGGWRADSFLRDRGLRSWREAVAFKPDIMFIGLGGNDDWLEQNQFIAYRTVNGMSEKDLRGIPTTWLRYFSPNGQNFDVDVSMLKIADISENSVSIAPKGVHFDKTPQAGDVLIIGDYFGDNRTVATCEISKWNADKLRASFAEKLKVSDIFGLAKLSDLKGKTVRIKRAPVFIENMKELIAKIRLAKPNVVLGLEDTPYANYRNRPLFGYPLRLKKLAREEGAWHVNTYESLKKWIHSRPLDAPLFLNQPGNQRASGATEYELVDANGRSPFGGYSLIRHFSVKVDGVERFGKGCHIEGGTSFGIKKGLDLAKIKMKPWRNRIPALKNSVKLPAKLVFTSNPPAQGSKVEIKCSNAKWSGDDCHLNQNGGQVYGDALIGTLKRIIKPKH